jgi:hypothetical protein
MSGTQNKRSSGQYVGPHLILLGGAPSIAAAIGIQQLQVGGGASYFENSHIDHLGTPYAVTLSAPMGPAVHGLTCGPGNGILNYSKIMSVDGHAAQQSNTKNYLYGLNCPVSVMVNASSANSHFYVAK